MQPNAAYVTPGVLWRALDPAGAEQWEAHWEASNQWPMLEPVRDAEPIPVPAVVLLDEIDKAEPDVPNNLLEVLGAFQFTVQESGTKVEARTTRPPLIVITSNDERDLPRAFLRRCVLLNLEPPTVGTIGSDRKIALRYWTCGPGSPADLRVPRQLDHDRGAGGAWRPTVGPSTAEYLDAVRACRDLGVQVDADKKLWDILIEVTLRKPHESLGVSHGST